MAFRTRKNARIRSGKKSNYSAAEKKAFKAGMAKQYDIEHPKFGFAAAEKNTYFNDDGTVFCKPIYGKVHFFKTEKEAKKYTAEINEKNKFANEHSREAIKSGKGGGSSLCVAEYKRIKPMRVKNEHCSYETLNSALFASSTSLACVSLFIQILILTFPSRSFFGIIDLLFRIKK